MGARSIETSATKQGMYVRVQASSKQAASKQEASIKLVRALATSAISTKKAAVARQLRKQNTK